MNYPNVSKPQRNSNQNCYSINITHERKHIYSTQIREIFNEQILTIIEYGIIDGSVQ